MFQYVPLLDGLVSLLKNPEIYSEVCKTIEVTYFQLIDLLFQVMKPHFRSDNLIGDYCDAELCKSIPLFNGTTSDNSLQIIMYFDELEVCNPLGGQAGIHKLGNFLIISTHDV